MESRTQGQQQQPISSCPSPLPSNSFSLLRDISNIRTPKQPTKNTNVPYSPYPHSQSKYFTASKATPISNSSRLRTLKTSATVARAKVARRLKAFELEQTKSARKVQIDKEKSLKSLAKSLTVWLNFLFENPKSCGCEVSRFTGEFDRSDDDDVDELGSSLKKKKRETRPGRGVKVGVEGPWRVPKRQKDLTWGGGSENGETTLGFSGLKASLTEVCSFEDFKERMRAYLSLASSTEIFDTMTQVTKVRILSFTRKKKVSFLSVLFNNFFASQDFLISNSLLPC